MTKIYTRIVLGPDLTVIESDSFDYQGPMATCTGAEPLAAEAVAGAGKGAEALGAEALAGEALGSELVPGVLGAEAGAEGLAAGLGAEGLGAGVAALPEAFGGFETLAGGGMGVGAPAVADVSSLAAAETAGNGLSTIGAGGADIAGSAGLDPALISEPFTEATTAGAGGAAPPVSSTPLDSALITEPPGTPGTGTGMGNIGQKLLDSITGNPLTAAALGLNAASAIAQRGAGDAAAARLREIGAPFSKEGESLLAQYHSGKLNPADEFNINKWEHEAIAQARGALGKQGGTALMSRIAAIQQQAQSMRESALRGLLSEGLKASGMAVGPLTNAVTAQAQQDSGFMSAQGNALQSLLLLQALQSKGA